MQTSRWIRWLGCHMAECLRFLSNCQAQCQVALCIQNDELCRQTGSGAWEDGTIDSRPDLFGSIWIYLDLFGSIWMERLTAPDQIYSYYM